LVEFVYNKDGQRMQNAEAFSFLVGLKRPVIKCSPMEQYQEFQEIKENKFISERK